MENYNGVVKDPRSEEQKALDYKHSDLTIGATVIWKYKKIEDLKKYTPRNQDGSLSCCAQGSSKGIETIVGEQMSATPPYRHRSNYPNGGMWVQDIGNVWYKFGSCLESEMNSQNMHESEMNAVEITIPTPYKVKGYIQPNCKNIDEIAQAIETWNHCNLIFHANGNEWKGKPVYNGQPINFGHDICGVDYFLDENGVKCIWIEDSAALTTTLDGQHRIITEDYLKARCEGAIYMLGMNPLEIPFKFTQTLRLGSRGLQVKKLQEFLKVTQDGIFGKITQRALTSFQSTHNLVPDGIVGPKTREVLNK